MLKPGQYSYNFGTGAEGGRRGGRDGQSEAAGRRLVDGRRRGAEAQVIVNEDNGFFDEGEDRPMIVGVSLQPVGHISTYLCGGIDLKRGDRVVVEADAGACFATVEVGPHPPAATLDLSLFKPVLRVADERDLRQEDENRYRDQEAKRRGVEGMRQRELEMERVNVGV